MHKNGGFKMNVVCIRSYEVEKQYQQYYEVIGQGDNNAKLGNEKSLHSRYVKAYVKLLTSNINKQIKLHETKGD